MGWRDSYITTDILVEEVVEKQPTKTKSKQYTDEIKLTWRHVAETRAKMSAGHKGKKHSAETLAKIGAGNKGKTISAEQRAKISAARSRPMMTPNGIYPSLKAVATAAGVNTTTVHTWKKKWPEHYYHIKETK